MSTLIQDNLIELQNRLKTMTEMTILAVNRSVEALKNKDVEEAERIKKEDKQINSIRWEIEEKCITLIATQQPVASDLRELIALLSIITELERIADYAAGISKIVMRIGDTKHIKPLIDIPRMAQIGVDMIEQSIDAYMTRDEQSARRIHKQDDEIDELYDQIYRELISFMIENPKNITQCTYLQWVSHNLERIGDRVTNICERIIYLVSGEMAEDLSK